MNKTRGGRIAILGIGHELRGDDAAGVEVVRRLKRKLTSEEEKSGKYLIIDAGPVPENFTGVLRRFRPNLVLMIDAALMDTTPGTIHELNWNEAEGFSSSSHTLPLKIFAAYLVEELGCEVQLLGIQPGDNRLGAPLTTQVEIAVGQTAKWIEAFLRQP